ncbi:MAG: HAMP domain-containing protein [Actinomycetota bacterium]|nr:HAMP domain-containing protein [Actinomycetota bacterium]
MLRNLKVGTKLVAILVAPLLVLGVLAGIGVAERLEARGRADDVTRLTEASGAVYQVIHAIQLEEIVTAIYLADPSQQNLQTVTNVRVNTDEAILTVNESFAAITDVSLSSEFDAAYEGAGQALAVLQGELRPDVDASPGTLELLEVVEDFGALSRAISAASFIIGVDSGVSELASDFTNLAELTDAKQAAADALAIGAAVSSAGAGAVEGSTGGMALEPVDVANTLDADLRAAEDGKERFLDRAGTQLQFELESRWAAPDATAARASLESIRQSLDTGQPQEFTAAQVDQLVNQGQSWLVDVLEVSLRSNAEIAANAADVRDDATATVRLYLLGAAIGIIVAVLLAFLVARATTRPLRRLTVAANTLATEQLPGLVERLRSAGANDTRAFEATPIEIDSRDEIGQLAAAINSIQATTIDVAEEQSSLLRKGISDIFVNLARRNQTLLDRQIEFIDELEANEEDPDQLDNLFRLDHLATRMRRNAESLLVLAGAEPTRRRSRPVPLADVVRVAVGEVEDFARIKLVALDDVLVSGGAAVDLAHLLSELMENATQFSPPETTVEVIGHRTKDQGYVISVSDQGIGMSLEQLADANHLLANPPLVGLALSRSLGFTVIGRLAARFGISVRLTTSPAGGVTALVAVPPSLMSESEGGAVGQGEPAAAGRLPADAAAAALPAGAPDAAQAENDAMDEAIASLLAEQGPGAAPPATPTNGLPTRGGVTTPTAPTGPQGFDAGPADLPTRRGAPADEAEPSVPEWVARQPQYDEPIPDQPFREQLPTRGAAPAEDEREMYAPPAAEARHAEPQYADGGQAFTYSDVDEGWSEDDGYEDYDEYQDDYAEEGYVDDGRDGYVDDGRDGYTDDRRYDDGAYVDDRRYDDGGYADDVRADDGGGAPAGHAPWDRQPLPARGDAPWDRPAEPLADEPRWEPDSSPPPWDPEPATAYRDEPQPRPPAHDGDGAYRDRQPQAYGHDGDLPAREQVPEPASVGATSAPGGEPNSLTAAGLVRRAPKRQVRGSDDAPAGPLARDRVGPSQRSPEEVRRMLSRYRTGLHRGRTETPPGDLGRSSNSEDSA